MNKVVNKNGKYSIVTEFTSRKKTFKPQKVSFTKNEKESQIVILYKFKVNKQFD